MIQTNIRSYLRRRNDSDKCYYRGRIISDNPRDVGPSGGLIDTLREVSTWIILPRNAPATETRLTNSLSQIDRHLRASLQSLALE